LSEMGAMNTIYHSLRELYETFRKQSEESAQAVHVVVCCDRVYMGYKPAARCRTCDKKPQCSTLESPEDLEHFLASLKLADRPSPVSLPVPR
jgi:uncharacterized paraquat-inducible protein A